VTISEPYDDRLMGELAALADGSLDEPRRTELEAEVAVDPALAAALAEQQRAVSLIRGAAAEVEAPLALRERIERDRGRVVRAPVGRRRPWLPSVALAGVAATVLAVVVALSGGPTVDDAAAFAGRTPTGAAPAVDGALLRASESGMVFPAWAEKFGWEATGTRRGEVDGRSATTVYYAKDGKSLAYTIVSGDALDGPDASRTVTVEGTPVDLIRAGGKPAVTWERGGHTCLLTGMGVPAAKLAALAGWTGRGAVAF